MKVRKFLRRSVLVTGLLGVSALILGLTLGATVVQASVSTDLYTYSSGDTVHITGDSMQGGENVAVDVTYPDGTLAQHHDVQADDQGNFSDSYVLPSDAPAGIYGVTATGDTSGITFSTTFDPGVGHGSLNCPTLTPYNDTHYKLQVGTTVTCTIDGADEVSGQATTNVWVKSSDLGNTLLTGTVSGTGSSTQITFTFTAPAGGCNTTIVAYGVSGSNPSNPGTNANNNIIKVANGHPNAGTSAAGFAYVGSNGDVIVCGGAPPAQDLTVSKNATPTFTRTYKWGISKSVNKTEIDTSSSATFNYTVSVTHDGTDSGWAVTGTITVKNLNNAAVTGVGVTDSIINDANAICSVTNGSEATIPAGSSSTFDYSCTYTAAPSSSTETNTATATWGDQKLSNGATLLGSEASGQASIDWSTTTPTIVDGSVTVTDSLGGTLGTVSYKDSSPKTFTYPYTFSGDTAGTCTKHPNTATFTTNTSGTTGSASQTVTVCVGADLKVSKDATPSFIRTYNWNITKSADKTKVTQAVGTTVTIKYTVTASQTGFTDSGWEATGNITVSNPNNWETVTLTGVTDSITGATCTVSGNTTQTIDASSDSKGLTYDCTFSSKPAYNTDITNTVTAMWDASAAFTPHGSAQGTKTFKFTTPTSTVNKTITVTDSYKGALDTVTATDSTPFATKTFTYTRTFNMTLGCNKFDNTATITETGQFATASVTICGSSGALTMGFWQNKNGQGIIAKYGCPTSGTSLEAYLQGYNPFKDAPTTCGKVGSTSSTDLVGYVYNIIKAATCSGPTSSPCNKMLRAQDLATTLDVYFSDPALGGIRIGAFNGLGNTQPVIGGLNIDLTQVCNMLDATDGTATCTGTYQDASNVFGFASNTGCATVSYLLGYANADGSATFSNGNPVATANTGATWYNNNKTKQVLAKNTFDAINNGAATGC